MIADLMPFQTDVVTLLMAFQTLETLLLMAFSAVVAADVIAVHALPIVCCTFCSVLPMFSNTGATFSAAFRSASMTG